ncbi:MAG: signal peptide peptidase SppA [Bacteroidetes bacterium]|nr:signal peptide peptidase SppA [Bacteroidota bacterium]
MKQFFKFFFASTLGFIFGAILLFLIGMGILASIASSFSEKEVAKIEEATILHFKPGMGIRERSVEDLNNFDINTFQIKTKQGLAEILSTLKQASADSRVKGMYLEIDPTFMAGYSTVKEIHDALISFHDSGKFIVAYSEILGERGYYLASVADDIYLNPSGNFIFNGLYAGVWFYKDALDKLGIEMQVFKHGKFKSAVEPYMFNEMSPANRLQVTRYVNSLFDTYLEDVARDRKMTVSELRNISDNMLIRSTEDAVKYKMISKLAYEDEVLADLRGRLDLDEDDKLPFLEMSAYLGANPPSKNIGKNKIAVLYANGVIQDDGQGQDVMSAKEIIKAIRKIRKDSTIKACVLRINSPGGSALASDLMYRELILLKEKMPLIVSMGDVAASGGYYIAAPADVIVAHPNTITGSIGVFGVIPQMQELLNEKMGIHVDGVKTGQFSDLGRIDRAMTPEEKAIIQAFIEQTYGDFTQIVSDNRHLALTAMDTLAEGRVWTGVDAKARGLVDQLGGIAAAIEIARKKSGLEEYRLISYPMLSSPLEMIFKMQKDAMAESLLKEQLGDQYQMLNEFRKATRIKGIQMRMPFEIHVE